MPRRAAPTGNSSEPKQRRDAPLHRDAPRHHRHHDVAADGRRPRHRAPALQRRRDPCLACSNVAILAIGARAGAQRAGAPRRGVGGVREGAWVGRAPAGSGSGRHVEEGGLSAARAARRAALLRRRQPLFRAGAWRRRSSDRASGRCSAHPSRAPRARCCRRRRRPLLAVFPSVCGARAHGSVPAPTLHVRTVVGICMYAATDDDKNASPAPGHCISVWISRWLQLKRPPSPGSPPPPLLLFFDGSPRKP